MQEVNETTTGAQGTRGREKFATALGVVLATLGSAVGLGNIWKFPSVTGTNGGAAFILVYLACTLLLGLPVMISEQLLGRESRADTITTFRKLAGKTPWWIIGLMGFASAFLIMAFYTEVAGWIFAYIPRAFSGDILTTDPAVTTRAFNDLVTNPVSSLVVQWIVLAVVGFIIFRGVQKGIENTARVLLPILFLLLIVVDIRSLTLPGAGKGVAFLLRPDFSQLTWAGVLNAMGLSFFKLSVGMGAMITYGSYFRDDQNIPATASRVMLADLLVSILAGLAIFPAAFAFGIQPDAGPSLLFITIPTIFASMPMGRVFFILFSLLAAIAPIGAMLSLIETAVAALDGGTKLGRNKSLLITLAGLAAVGSLAALSNSLLADARLFGMTFFDLFDFITSNILLPVGGLLLCLFVAWYWGFDRTRDSLTNGGTIRNETLVRGFFFMVRFVSPVLILIVLLNGLGLLS